MQRAGKSPPLPINSNKNTNLNILKNESITKKCGKIPKVALAL